MAKNSHARRHPITYADAGVDIDRANRTKKRIKYLAHKTFTRGVLSEIGGFGGLFAVDKTKYVDPVLVSSVDGVGTKLKIAFEMECTTPWAPTWSITASTTLPCRAPRPFFHGLSGHRKLEPESPRKWSKAWPKPASTTAAP